MNRRANLPQSVEVVGEDLGQVLRRMRLRQGMSQLDLAAITDMHRQTLSSLENGRRGVGLVLLAVEGTQGRSRMWGTP